MGWHAQEQRDKLREWVESPLSVQEQDYRVLCLARAFALPEEYIRKLLLPPIELPPIKGHPGPHLQCAVGCGFYLMRDILGWALEHPDLGRNNPLDENDLTFWVDMGDMG